MTENNSKANEFIAFWKSNSGTFAIHTSGSTGEPTLFQLERDLIEASCATTGEFLQIKPSDSIFCCLPCDKAGGLMQIARASIWNIPIEIVEPSANPFLTTETKATIVSLTPMQLHHILEDRISLEQLNRFRIVLIGGSEISNGLESEILQLEPTFYHTYGMTETYSHVAMRNLKTENHFYPLPGITLDSDNNQCLKIKGAVTKNEWLQTRDVVSFHGAGFTVLGRLDNVINSGGHKIQSEMVEAQITGALGLPENAVLLLGKKDAILGQKAVLLVNQKQISALPVLKEEMFDHKYDMPREIIYLPEFIFTETGKIARTKTIELLTSLQGFEDFTV